MDIKEQILVALGLNKDESVKLEWQAKSEDGTIFVSTAEELASGVDISVLTEDGTTILLPIGTYKTAEGVTFRVEEEGVVAEVMETETEEEVEATEDKEGGDDEVEEMSEEVVEEVSDKPKSIKTTEVVEFSAEDELENLKAENEKLKTELAASPADTPINVNKFSSESNTTFLSKKDYGKLSKKEKFLYNLYN